MKMNLIWKQIEDNIIDLLLSLFSKPYLLWEAELEDLYLEGSEFTRPFIKV